MILLLTNFYEDYILIKRQVGNKFNQITKLQEFIHLMKQKKFKKNFQIKRLTQLKINPAFSKISEN